MLQPASQREPSLSCYCFFSLSFSTFESRSDLALFFIIIFMILSEGRQGRRNLITNEMGINVQSMRYVEHLRTLSRHCGRPQTKGRRESNDNNKKRKFDWAYELLISDFSLVSANIQRCISTCISSEIWHLTPHIECAYHASKPSKSA